MLRPRQWSACRDIGLGVGQRVASAVLRAPASPSPSSLRRKCSDGYRVHFPRIPSRRGREGVWVCFSRGKQGPGGCEGAAKEGASRSLALSSGTLNLTGFPGDIKHPIPTPKWLLKNANLHRWRKLGVKAADVTRRPRFHLPSRGVRPPLTFRGAAERPRKGRL